jgi:hypothetical protein
MYGGWENISGPLTTTGGVTLAVRLPAMKKSVEPGRRHMTGVSGRRKIYSSIRNNGDDVKSMKLIIFLILGFL